MRKAMMCGAGSAVAVMLASTSVAAAAPGDRTLAETYPVATVLCAKAAAGTLPKRLAPSSAQVLVACATLENAFPPLVGAVTAAEGQFTATVAAEQALVSAACPTPVINHRLCRSTRIRARGTITSARHTRRDAVRLFYSSLETNRRTFWSTIHSLRGGSQITSDQPVQTQSS